MRKILLVLDLVVAIIGAWRLLEYCGEVQIEFWANIYIYEMAFNL